MALKPIIISWIRTGSDPYWKIADNKRIIKYKIITSFVVLILYFYILCIRFIVKKSKLPVPPRPPPLIPIIRVEIWAAAAANPWRKNKASNFFYCPIAWKYNLLTVNQRLSILFQFLVQNWQLPTWTFSTQNFIFTRIEKTRIATYIKTEHRKSDTRII